MLERSSPPVLASVPSTLEADRSQRLGPLSQRTYNPSFPERACIKHQLFAGPCALRYGNEQSPALAWPVVQQAGTLCCGTAGSWHRDGKLCRGLGERPPTAASHGHTRAPRGRAQLRSSVRRTPAERGGSEQGGSGLGCPPPPQLLSSWETPPRSLWPGGTLRLSPPFQSHSPRTTSP